MAKEIFREKIQHMLKKPLSTKWVLRVNDIGNSEWMSITARTRTDEIQIPAMLLEKDHFENIATELIRVALDSKKDWDVTGYSEVEMEQSRTLKVIFTFQKF